MIVQLAGLLFAVNADELTLCEGDYYSRDEEQTQAPEIIGEQIYYNDYNYWYWRITITDEYEEEPCTIYYRVAELDEDNWSEWMEYETSLVFTERGHYYIEAYAIADGKLPSQLSSYEFIAFAPDYPPTMRGDVDGDGEVAIADVSALIDYLLTGNASAINLDAADVDTDGEVSIADVSALIDYLLTGAW